MRDSNGHDDRRRPVSCNDDDRRRRRLLARQAAARQAPTTNAREFISVSAPERLGASRERPGFLRHAE